MRLKQIINHKLFALLSFTSILGGVKTTFAAPTLVFGETWDEASAPNAPSRWRTTNSNFTIDSGAAEGPALATSAQDANVCSGAYLKETPANQAWSGRVFLRPTAKISVAAGDSFCLAANVRRATGSNPYIGINYVGASGYSDTRGNYVSYWREHLLIGPAGGYLDATNLGANVPWSSAEGNAMIAAYGQSAAGVASAASPGTWGLFRKAWKVINEDLKAYPGVDANTANAMILKLFNFGGNGQPSATAAADFGDIYLFKMDPTADNASLQAACDALNLTTLAPYASPHAACSGSTSYCVDYGIPVAPAPSWQHKIVCAGCSDSYSSTGVTTSAVGEQYCSEVTPVCNSSQQCTKCDTDLGVTGSACYDAANPYCISSGTSAGKCGKCTSNADCSTVVAGYTHAGAKCDLATGACASGCSTSADCTATQWCKLGTTVGVCTAKIANDVALPTEHPSCIAAVGTEVCESGVCDTDNKCGKKNNQNCSSAAACRGGICHTDGRCGLPDYAACTQASECRIGACSDGTCSKCTSDAECGINSGKMCNTTSGACEPGCNSVQGCPQGQVCDSRTTTPGQCVAVQDPPDAGAPDVAEETVDAAEEIVDIVEDPTVGGDEKGGCSCNIASSKTSDLLLGAGLLAFFATLFARKQKRASK